MKVEAFNLRIRAEDVDEWYGLLLGLRVSLDNESIKKHISDNKRDRIVKAFGEIQDILEEG